MSQVMLANIKRQIASMSPAQLDAYMDLALPKVMSGLCADAIAAGDAKQQDSERWDGMG